MTEADYLATFYRIYKNHFTLTVTEGTFRLTARESLTFNVLHTSLQRGYCVNI